MVASCKPPTSGGTTPQLVTAPPVLPKSTAAIGVLMVYIRGLDLLALGYYRSP